jgi:hypothetical protein
VPNRRIFELMLLTIVLWDLGKGTLRLWERRALAVHSPSDPRHVAAELGVIFTG